MASVKKDFQQCRDDNAKHICKKNPTHSQELTDCLNESSQKDSQIELLKKQLKHEQEKNKKGCKDDDGRNPVDPEACRSQLNSCEEERAYERETASKAMELAFEKGDTCYPKTAELLCGQNAELGRCQKDTEACRAESGMQHPTRKRMVKRKAIVTVW